MTDESVPKDPYMLLSFINTQLRDRFPSLTGCCEYYGIDSSRLEKKLEEIDYRYDPRVNQFV